MHTHTHTDTQGQRHLQVTIIIVGIIPRMVIIKGSFELPSRLGKMIWPAPNNELWESACPALIFLPCHPLQGCQSDGQIKDPQHFSFSLMVPFFSLCQEGSHWSAGMIWKLNYLLTGPLKQPSMTYCAGESRRSPCSFIFLTDLLNQCSPQNPPSALFPWVKANGLYFM